MIPVEILREVRKVIVHADCPDGTASAMILHDALPDAEIVAVNYGPERDALDPEPGLLFCDMTPPLAKAEAFVEAGTIVLDHHKGAAELVAMFGELGVFADEETEPGVSGATLAYREVWMLLGHGAEKIDSFAAYAGIRDTWQTKHPLWRAACAQAETLSFYPFDHWVPRDPLLPAACLSQPESNLGFVLLDKKLALARKTAESGCIRIGSAALFNADGRVVSDVAEAMREIDPSVEIVCGFFYEAHHGRMVLIFSMRSSPGGPDVGAIAKANGGGGHTHAAGFTLRQNLLCNGPIELFKASLGRFYTRQKNADG